MTLGSEGDKADRQDGAGLRVLHITGGRPNDGAARSAVWLHERLLAMGIRSQLVTQFSGGYPPPDAPSEFRSSVSSIEERRWLLLKMRVYRKLEAILLRHMKRRGPGYYFSIGRLGANPDVGRCGRDFDIVHLHWIGGGTIGDGYFKALARAGTPIVWTLRDMWPVTGGCHYSLGCTRYREGCGYCPMLKTGRLDDLSHRRARRKRDLYTRNVHPVAISRWLRDVAAASHVMAGLDIRYIPNGIPLEDFFPVDRNHARTVLGLPPDMPVILFGVQNWSARYKGGAVLREALSRLADRPYLFAGFGGSDHEFTDLVRGRPADLRQFGFIEDNERLRLLYAAADVFVIPSPEEAFGKTAAEAMACGTPVAAFDDTGITDIVSHKETGYLARNGNSESLAKGIEWCLALSTADPEVSRRCHERVSRSFSMDAIAAEYLKLYRSLARQHAERPAESGGDPGLPGARERRGSAVGIPHSRPAR